MRITCLVVAATDVDGECVEHTPSIDLAQCDVPQELPHERDVGDVCEEEGQVNRGEHHCIL